METIEYKDVIDKTSWARGEWDNELDKKQWLDPISGLPCMIKRNHMGVWCGYVGLSESHLDYGRDYADVDADVHGGLTYADFCQDESDPAHSICHVTDDGKPVWWLGFDCGHSFDLTPRMLRDGFPAHSFETYRNQAYVEAQVLKLALQLKG